MQVYIHRFSVSMRLHVRHLVEIVCKQHNCVKNFILPSPGRMMVAKSRLMSRVARAQVLSVLPLDIRQLLAYRHLTGERQFFH